VPLLILAGMAVGPHAPKIGPLDFRFIESAPLIEFMGRVGVLFLLFYLGLEFSVSRLIKSGRSIVVGGSIYIAVNFALGLAYAALLGWPLKEVLVCCGDHHDFVECDCCQGALRFCGARLIRRRK
jgi:CPA2 family monovalent cation:H+ antiporter-2